MSSPNIINIANLDYRPTEKGQRFQARIGAIGSRIGAQKLGYNVTVLPPRKRAFPFHNHRVNEEMFFVLEGEGEIRIGTGWHAIRQGDVIACPPSGPEQAHQIVNTSATAELRFLAVSTRLSPDIAEYPDTGKFGVLAELPTGPGGQMQPFRFVGRPEATLDYWEGEETD
jgi:uncharacterized cupin superfamily protein